MLEAFCGELKRANLGSAVFVEANIDEEVVSRFIRLYTWLEPIKGEHVCKSVYTASSSRSHE